MEQQNVITKKKGRSGLLTILCICTFIWSGIMTLFFLIGIFASGIFSELLEEYISDISFISNSITVVMAVSFIFWFLSLFGAIKMMQLKKSGFILYVIPNTLMLIPQIALIYFIPSVHWFIYLYTFVSVLFIIFYAVSLKRMR